MGKPKYETRPLTNYGAKLIDNKLNSQHQPRFVLVNIGTGGGKTFMSIHAVGRVSKNAHVVVITTKKQVDAHHWEDSFDSYNEATRAHLTYTVKNYEYLNNHYQELGGKMARMTKRPLIMILDEAHRAKSTQSKVGKKLKNLSHLPTVKATIALTATMVGNSLIDATNYLIMAGFYRNKTQFNNEHVKFFDDYWQPIVKDRSGKIRLDFFKNPQEVIDQLNSVTVQFDTTKLLPKRNLKTIEFEYDKATQHEYRQINKAYRDGVYDSIMTALADQRTFVAEHAPHRDKYLSLIINSPSRVNDPVLVFYQYVAEREHLLKYFHNQHPNYDVQRIDGETHKKKGDAAGFPAPKNPKTIVLIQYQAGSEGLNASWSHTAVFYAPPVSWFKYKQAMGRNVRAYQEGTVNQFRFVVRKTINQHYWYDLIDEKQKFSSSLKRQFIEAED